jgi:PRC-barrel domain protein
MCPPGGANGVGELTQQMEKVGLEDARAWPGLEVFDRDGEPIGRLTAIYLDAESGTPAFGLVRTGLFGLRSLLVPLAGAFEEGGALIVDLAKDSTKGAPHLRRDEPLPPELEEELYAHYGMDAPPSANGRPRLELWSLERTH